MRFRRMGLMLFVLGMLMPLATATVLSAAEQNVAASIQTVDLNKAGIGELSTVPGIGAVMAQRIIDWRTENGPFQRIEDLMKVKGFGEKKLEKLRPYLRVGR